MLLFHRGEKKYPWALLFHSVSKSERQRERERGIEEDRDIENERELG